VRAALDGKNAAVPPGPSLAEQVSDRVDIDSALARLSPEMRAVVVLRHQLGLDYAQIANVLAIPPGTVRSRLARACRKLADHLVSGTQSAPSVRPTTRS
jgi:RNA polymerase sigma-70 factor (ECF subfamily)